MTPERLLLRVLDYDQWANRQWIRALGAFRDLERAQRVLEHLLASHRYWLGICGIEIVLASVDVNLENLFADMTDAWKALVESGDLDEPFPVALGDGRSGHLTLGDIALHVVNHGTYHRGHLRGLAEAEGSTQFPETDLAAVLLE